MNEKLLNALQNRSANHIFPFLWLRGEDDQTLITELHSIYTSGIRAVCVEPRPHPEFGREGWYDDIALLLA